MGVYGIRFNTSSLPSSSLDRSSCIGVYSGITPSPAALSLYQGSPVHAWLVTGVHERIHSTEFTRFEIPHRAAEFSFVRLPCLERGKRGSRRGEKMDDPRGSVLQILAQYRRILNNVPAEIQSEKLAKGKRNRGFSTIFESKFFFFFFRGKGKKKCEWRFDVSIRRRREKYRYKPMDAYFCSRRCYILIVELSNPWSLWVAHLITRYQVSTTGNRSFSLSSIIVFRSIVIHGSTPT